VERPADPKAWPWLALSSEQFGGARTFRLSSPKRASQTLNVSPILLTVKGSCATPRPARVAVRKLLALAHQRRFGPPGGLRASCPPGACAGPRHLCSATHVAGTRTRVCRFCHRIRQNRTGCRFALKSSRSAIPCVFAREPSLAGRRALVRLDGTERHSAVMFEADTIKREADMTARSFSLFCLNQIIASSTKVHSALSAPDKMTGPSTLHQIDAGASPLGCTGALTGS